MVEAAAVLPSRGGAGGQVSKKPCGPVREVGWGGKKLENQRRKEAMHKQGVFEDKGKEAGVERRERPLSEEGSEEQKL